MARAVAASITLLAAVGVAAASADGLPSSPPEQHLASSGSTNLAGQGFDGRGVTVAIIDTGVADVPGLHGKLVHQENLSSAPAEGDQYGHGTFVAGLVHQAAPEAEIVSIKLSDANGAVDVTQVFAALYWVITHREQYGIDVVNLSFGNDSKQSAYTSPLNWAVQQLWDAGIVVVASAGNLGDGSNTVTKPGDDPIIISVGSSDENGTPELGDDVVSSFSSRGPTQDGLTKPDLVAPGARLISLRAPGSTVDTLHPEARIGESHFRGSGTSFAAPLATGVVAQILSADPTLTPDQVKFGLLSGAKAISGASSAQGAGAVRAHRALNAARSGSANRDARRSSGTGSIDAARGSAKVKVRTRVRSKDGSIDIVPVTVTGNATTLLESTGGVDEGTGLVGQLVDRLLGEEATPLEELAPLERSELLDSDAWEASQWGASQWGASQWGASQWGASQWGASQWGASQWGASQWGASQWGSSQWWASQWG